MTNEEIIASQKLMIDGLQKSVGALHFELGRRDAKAFTTAVAEFEGYLDGETPMIKWLGPQLPVGAKFYVQARADSAAIQPSGEPTAYKLRDGERIFYSRLGQSDDGLPFMTDSSVSGVWDVAMVFGLGEKRPRHVFIDAVAAQPVQPVAAPDGWAEEAAKLAPILRNMCEGGDVHGDGVDIYAEDYQAGDGDIYVVRAAALLDEIAAAPAAPASAPVEAVSVLPDEREPNSSDPRDQAHAAGWNACLDAIRALQGKPEAPKGGAA